MRELCLAEIKKYELNILLDVASFCDEHALKYFIAYGTLIGAVRHKGFIPWDDDIDIQMPRPDYEKFLKLYNEKGKNNSIYRVINPNEKASKHTFAKVVDIRTKKVEQGIKYNEDECLGIDIDIFPLDGQPFDENIFLKYYKTKFKEYRKFSHIVTNYLDRSLKGKIAFAIPYLLAMITGKKRILNKIDKINKLYLYDESEFVGATSSLYNSQKNRFKKEWFEDFVELTFEGYTFKAPCGYHEVLTKMYGDYMQLPPIDQQITHHTNKIYIKEG